MRFAQFGKLTLMLVFATPLLAAPPAQARSGWARADFVRRHPCPVAAIAGRLCPGYVVDHLAPLCDGGRDDASNMAWQAVAEAKEKDRAERALCRLARRQSR